MKGMLLNRPPTSGYESRCSSAAALKATNSSAKHRPLWLQRLRSWAGNVTQGAPNEPSTQRGLMPAGSDVQWLVGPLHDNFRYIGASINSNFNINTSGVHPAYVHPGYIRRHAGTHRIRRTSHRRCTLHPLWAFVWISRLLIPARGIERSYVVSCHARV